MSPRQRIECCAPSIVATMEPEKAARWNASTMLIPSPADIEAEIQRIPAGLTRTVNQLRKDMARAAGADVTCPRATTVGWLLVAEVAEELRGLGEVEITPYWRLTRDGKLEKRLPGGAEHQRELLGAEGVNL